MRIRKRTLRRLAGKLAWLLLLAMGWMLRARLINRRYWYKAHRMGGPVLVCLWHGKMLLPIYAHRFENIVAMVSEHGDGEAIARTVERIGYDTVRGSSKRGGSRAFKDMLRHMRQGRTCAILPDGPTGPRRQLKPGAALLAQRTEAVILPMTFAAKHPIVFNSWDRFTIWRPFSKGALIYGEPFKVMRQSKCDWKTVIETRMNQLEAEADALF
ncbi:MAG: lysophospholipid acyltransferase family protein [candidate division KSB1 bacterium]|nr:lysophospholipid acyltransferase family protein [candidate division KSB1 bacterium]